MAVIPVETAVACDACEGSGRTELATCPDCGGSGASTRRSGGIAIRYQCARCDGSGGLAPEPCPACDGRGRRTGSRDVTLRVPAGR